MAQTYQWENNNQTKNFNSLRPIMKPCERNKYYDSSGSFLLNINEKLPIMSLKVCGNFEVSILRLI